MKKILFFAILCVFAGQTISAQTSTSNISVKLGDDQRSVVIGVSHPQPLATEISLFEYDGALVVEKRFKPKMKQQLTINCRELSDGVYTIAVCMEGKTFTNQLRIVKRRLFIEAEEMLVSADVQNQ